MQCFLMLWYFARPVSMVRLMNKNGSPEDASATKHTKKVLPIQMAVGARIRQLRERQGIAQETFAYDAGLNRAWYGSVERGRYNITVSNLVRIALALGVEVGELFPTSEELRILEASTDPTSTGD